VATKTFSKEDKAKYKEEKMAEQRQMIESALAELTSSDAWSNWIKYGRPNLKRLSFTNALLIWSQRKDATVVWGQKQWESKGVKVNADAQKIRYLAPCMGFKYENGQQVFGADGKPVRVVKFFKTVTGYDVQDTDAPASDLDLMVEITGDDYLHLHAPLESFARELGIVVRYREDTGKANGWYDERNSEIVMNKNLSGNELVRTLVHELCHAYGECQLHRLHAGRGRGSGRVCYGHDSLHPQLRRVEEFCPLHCLLGRRPEGTRQVRTPGRGTGQPVDRQAGILEMFKFQHNFKWRYNK
jgi:hypothetical protein